MSYQFYKQHIIDTLTRTYKPFRMMNLSDQTIKGALHQVTTDFLFDMQTRRQIYEYNVRVGTINFMRLHEGYTVEITIWPDDKSPADIISMEVTPLGSATEDPTKAYNRAMKIL